MDALQHSVRILKLVNHGTPTNVPGPLLQRGKKTPCWMILFPTLPGEIRNQIYADVAAETELLIHQGDARDPFTVTMVRTSELFNIHPQLFDEFLPFAYKSASVIRTTVTDFDFSHLTSFMKHLYSKTEQPLYLTNQTPDRRFIIELHVTSNCSQNIRPLQTWLGRFENIARNSIDNYEYRLSKGSDIQNSSHVSRFLRNQALHHPCPESALEALLLMPILCTCQRPHDRTDSLFAYIDRGLEDARIRWTDYATGTEALAALVKRTRDTWGRRITRA